MIWYGLVWVVPEVPAVQKKLLSHQNGQNWRSIKETEVKERLPKKSFGPWLKRGVKPLPESFAPSTKLNSVWWKKLYKLPELRAGGRITFFLGGDPLGFLIGPVFNLSYIHCPTKNLFMYVHEKSGHFLLVFTPMFLPRPYRIFFSIGRTVFWRERSSCFQNTHIGFCLQLWKKLSRSSQILTNIQNIAKTSFHQTSHCGGFLQSSICR